VLIFLFVHASSKTDDVIAKSQAAEYVMSPEVGATRSPKLADKQVHPVTLKKERIRSICAIHVAIKKSVFQSARKTAYF
jgi:hypothetical protein